MNDRFQQLALFVRVAETGSFSRAGREIGMAQPTVSRIIGALEARLGVKLLVRTTRQVTVTEAGKALLAHARGLLDGVEEAEAAARNSDSLSGRLRVATAATFGARVIVPALPPFLVVHPQLQVELLMSDRRIDLVDEGVDLAIRLGALDDSGFVSRRLTSGASFLVASPSYLSARGAPDSAAALASHDLILAQPSGNAVWTFRDRDDGQLSIRVTARLTATSVEGVVAAAVAGLGIAAVSQFACRAELERGALVRVLQPLALPPVDVHAVFPAGRRPPAKARAFVDFLAQSLDVAS